MSAKNNFPGVELKFYLDPVGNITATIDWDRNNEEELPINLAKLIAFVRSPKGLIALIGAFRKLCKSLKKKHIYKAFALILKAQSINDMRDHENSPMISPMEVLGRKRLS